MRIISILSVLSFSVFAETVSESLYKQGLLKLREAQTDHAALIPATRLLVQAVEAFERDGDEIKGAEINSCLYWARKKMTLADTIVVKSDVQVLQRLETVAKPIPVDEAKALLSKADEFAKTHADDPLLIAIRYFEIGDRFKDNDIGRSAIDKSLKAMQDVGAKARLAEYKPAPTDGKAFVKSEPSGAAIILVIDGGKIDTGKKTPSLIQLPVGKQTIELSLKGCKPSSFSVEVDGKTIIKPETAKMEPMIVLVDIIFEDGWRVFVDSKPAKATGTAETPCTVDLPLGRHEIELVKEGFLDVTQIVDVVEGGVKEANGVIRVAVEVKRQPNQGLSKLLAAITASKTSVIVTEKMGYTTSVMKKGVSSHMNKERGWISVPAELNGKQFTQVVSGCSSAVTIRFVRPGTIYVMFQKHPDDYQLDREVAKKFGKNTGFVLSNGPEIFEVWSIIGAVDQKIIFPIQMIVIADEIQLNK